MLGIMIQKMWHKLWMNLSLLLGCVLLVATVVSFPLYQKAAYDRMLQDEFKNYISTQGLYPTTICMKNSSMKDKAGKGIRQIEEKMSSLDEDLGVQVSDILELFLLTRADADSDMNRPDGKDISFCVGSYTDLENHIEIVSGENFSETGMTADGKIEVLVSQSLMTSKGILVSEGFTFSTLRMPDGSPVHVEIKGVFKPNKDMDYWQIGSQDMIDTCFVKMDCFRDIFLGDNVGKYNINCTFFSLLDYESMTADQIPNLIRQSKYLQDKSKYRSVTRNIQYLDLLDEFSLKINRISATLLILQIPVLLMLAAFLLMISGQMYEMEKNEISVIKSRGSSRGQIYRLYLYQGILLTLLGGALGTPLGALFSRVLGAVRNFLEFDESRVLHIVYTKESMYYVLGAMVITLLSMTIPAISHSKVSIVKLKQSRNLNKKSLWKKLYLDMVLLGISAYGYYTFHKNMQSISGSVLEGQSLDPLLYLSSSLFIIGMGLLFLRIQPFLIKIVFAITKKFLRPAGYISLMEAMKQGTKQQLIILFLIMTVSLGMYHSTVARTILDNAVKNTDYADGADMILAERWVETVDENGAPTGVYIEPDFKKYASMNFAEKYSRVYVDDEAGIAEDNYSQKIKVMGIHTKEFGQETSLDASLNSEHYYSYLNALATEKDGVLVSENFRKMYGYDIGDVLYFSTGKVKGIPGKIVGFMEYFPTYAPSVTDISPDGSSVVRDQYLIVTHYDYIRQKTGVKPYEIWISLKEGTTENEIYDWISDKDIRVQKYVNRNSDLSQTMEDPLLQGTNGILTLGFVVTLVLCAVGYLIYWVMSIKDRELIFGVLRAGGFHKGELVSMLLLEQLFAGVFAVFAGIGIGFLSSKLFVPIIQLSYASKTQILPMTLTMNSTDLMRLYLVIALVMLTCLGVLISILFSMNVTKALKLGEE